MTRVLHEQEAVPASIDGQRLDVTKDGRNVDPDYGLLTGEGSTIQVKKDPEIAYPIQKHVVSEVPSHYAGYGPTYYEQPAVKPPVWIWTIPTYFWVGGATGGILVLGVVADHVGEHRDLVRWSKRLGVAGAMTSSVLLISDLGRPSRFLNMLRVFRPTSPMSVGSWILASTGASATAWWLFGDAPGILGRIGRIAGIFAGLLGAPLAAYTAVLITNTAVPLWKSVHRTLPVLFVASGVVAAAGVLELFPLGEGDARIVGRFGTIGKVAELAADFAVEHEARSESDRVAQPLEEGVSGDLWKAAKILTAASLVVGAIPTTRRWVRVISGVLGSAGALALRFGIFHGGKRSSRDPHAVFDPQRASRERRERQAASPA